jgi:4-hydroxy-2-oxoheptanedioate aldolase
MLTARQQIEELVAATRYSPAGERSVSMAHVTADYGARTLAEYVADELEAPPVLIGQIETAKTVDPLDELARPPLDAVFIGTADLSVSLNHPGEMSHPAMRTRLEAIAETCRAADLPLGAYAGSAEAIPALVGTGVSYVALGADLSMLFAKMTGEAKSAKESFGGAR